MVAPTQAELVKTVPNPSARQVLSVPEAEPRKIQDWVLSPDGKLTGDPAGALALGMASAGALNGNEPAQAEAAELFRTVIEPIINPGRYAELHRTYPRREDLVKHLAEQIQKHPRTVYRLVESYQQNGITGLVRKIRADKDQSRVLNTASKNFIIAAVLPRGGTYGELSNADVWRLHEEERRWREEHATKPLSHATGSSTLALWMRTGGSCRARNWRWLPTRRSAGRPRRSPSW